MKTKALKRAEAAARQAVFDSLGHDAKLALVESRPGRSTRERVRLTARQAIRDAEIDALLAKVFPG